MHPFVEHTGQVAVLNRANVDTDQIIPKQFLKRIERTGFGEYLFFDWRYLDDGQENPDFELNRPSFRDATILAAGRNFGSGSSREHAVWALADYGFRAVIAPSFADIFYNNCFKNGLLPVTLPEPTVGQIMERAAEDSEYRVTVDLKSQHVRDNRGLSEPFDVDPDRRERLLQGLDDIAVTLQNEERITEYEREHGIA